METIFVQPCPSAEPPVADDDLIRWARAFAGSPAVTEQDQRHRWIVSDLLAELLAESEETR